MNFLKKIDHYLLTNHPILWRTRVHYFVLFSLILGNVGAASIGGLLYEANDIAFGFGLMLLGFSTLFWLISQARNKIKNFGFWDEVLTFSVYMLCAMSLFVNFVVLTQIPIFQHGYEGNHPNGEVLLAGGSLFVFIAATTVYLIAHTGVVNILGIVLLHFVLAPLVIFTFRNPMVYVILFAFLFVLFCILSENNRTYRFIRFFLVPYIPTAVLMCFIYLTQFTNLLDYDNTPHSGAWVILPIMIVTTIFGSTLIIKRNIEPS